MTAALIRHPAFGSVWLEDIEIKDGIVVGWTWDLTGVGSGLMPDDYHGERLTMNFPVGCIAKLDSSQGEVTGGTA